MALDKSIKLTGAGEAFLKELKELGKLEVAVGYQRDDPKQKKSEKDDDGNERPSLVDIAAWNELGTEPSGKVSGIPSRPFLRDSVNLHKDELNEFVAKVAQQIVNGGSAKDVLMQIGVKQRDLVQQQIRTGTYKENAKSTIRKKGSAHPLIDQGFLVDLVNFYVRERGGG